MVIFINNKNRTYLSINKRINCSMFRKWNIAVKINKLERPILIHFSFNKYSFSIFLTHSTVSQMPSTAFFHRAGIFALFFSCYCVYNSNSCYQVKSDSPYGKQFLLQN